MLRTSKLSVALVIALAVHAALLLYGFAPRLDGLIPAAERAATPAADATATAPGEAPAVPEIAEADAADASLDIDWPLPEEPLPEELPAEESVTTSSRELAKAAPPATKPTPTAPAGQKAKPADIVGGNQAAGSVSSADASYANRVRQHLARYAGALPPGASGEARVQFVVQPDGRVSNVLLVMKSGNAGLDSVALSLPTLAQPLPLPGPQPQRLEVPVQAMAAAP